MIGIGIGAGFLAGAAFGMMPPAAVGIVLICWQIAVRRSPSWIAAGVIAAAVVIGAWRGVPLPRTVELPWLDDTSEVSGVVAGSPRIGGASQSFFLNIDAMSESAEGCDGELRLYVSGPPLPQVGLGDRVWISGAFQPGREFSTGFQRYLRANCAAGTWSAFTVRVEDHADDWRRHVFLASSWLDRLLTAAAPGDRGALLSGLVTGRDDALSEERKDAFRATGTSHITAVSGSNLALLVTIAAVSGRMFGVRRHRGWQVGVVVALWGYALLAGFQPPVNRAAIVATGAVCAVMVGRRADVITLLALGGAALVAIDPVLLWSLSFQLSLAASIALALVFDPNTSLNGIGGLIRAAVTVTVTAQLATLPFAVGLFGQISLVAIPANLAIAPLVQSAFLLAALGGLVGGPFPVLGELTASGAAIPAALTLEIVDWLSFPGAAVPFHTGRVGTALVAAGCVLALCCWSRDGQMWLERTVRDAAAHRIRVAALLGTAGVAAAVVIASTT